MAEATPIIHPQPSFVIATLARQSALNAVKKEARAKGLKVSHFAVRELSIMAQEYIAQHRQALIAETWEPVQSAPELRALYEKEERARLRQLERNSQHSHSAGSPAAQGFLRCISHVRNGGPDLQQQGAQNKDGRS